jgi:hypothetical protein
MSELHRSYCSCFSLWVLKFQDQSLGGFAYGKYGRLAAIVSKIGNKSQDGKQLLDPSRFFGCLLQETQQSMVKFGLRWARQLRHRLLGQENPGVVELIFPKTSQFFQTELMLLKSTLALDCGYCLHNTGPCWAKAEADYRAEQRPFGHGRHDRYAHPVWDPKRRPVAVHPFGLRSKFTEVKSQ